MADPAAYDQPSYMNSALYSGDSNDAVFAAINSGVGNKLWYLLVDGDTHRDYAVAGLGEAVVRDLVWEAQSMLPASAGYQDLYLALRDAAITLYTSGSNPTEDEVVAELEQAAKALDIWVDVENVTYNKGTGCSGLCVVEKSLCPNASDGYEEPTANGAPGKEIQYKVLIPTNGMNLGARGTASWPLDVIIFSHGVGGHRGDGMAKETTGEVAIARHWAEQGYIVVTLTYTKRIHFPTGKWRWQLPNQGFNAFKAISDIARGSSARAEEFFIDRVRDLRYVYDHLHEIINVPGTGGDPEIVAYDPSQSKVGLSGHSFGALTTLLAAGNPFVRGSSNTLIDPEANGFPREFDNGTPSDTSDDFGAFIPNEGILLLNGAYLEGCDELVGKDSTRPNLVGKDYVQDPLLVMIGQDDLPWSTDPDRKLLPVTDAFGLNDNPSYGSVIENAGHISSIRSIQIGDTVFKSSASGPGMPATLDEEEGTAQEKIDYDALVATPSSDPTLLERVKSSLVWSPNPGSGGVTPEDDRTLHFLYYSRSFWDAFLTPEYNGATAKAFLDLDDSEHIRDPLEEVLDSLVDPNNQNAENRTLFFAHSSPTKALIIQQSDGTKLVQFQSDGNVLVLQGGFLANTIFITQNPAWKLLSPLFEGNTAARSNLLTSKLYIRGSLFENQSVTIGASPLFAIRSSRDQGNDAQIIIDSNGNMKLRGYLFDVDFGVPIDCPHEE